MLRVTWYVGVMRICHVKLLCMLRCYVGDMHFWIILPVRRGIIRV